jgi:ethanolamine ammonia-lyase small subunit
MDLPQRIPEKDPWESLRKFTNARIALGRTGVSIPVRENLSFKLAHAFARDSVYTSLDLATLIEGLQKINHPFQLLHSMALDREQYLQRPDLGRRLNDASITALELDPGSYDICINMADGLSAAAINHHAIPLLFLLLPMLLTSGFSIAPVCVIEQGRVAISDETGNCLHAKLSIILIGERPGLSSPDSLGVYLTYHPEVGNTDVSRNCISNIGSGGLSYKIAAEKIFYLITESIRLKLSGVGLKDLSGLINE